MNKVITLTAFASQIHTDNREAGWWDEPRSHATFVNLFHSELSEAMEGHRKDLMDDHLSHHKMMHVEIADFAIRLLDYLGSQSCVICFKPLTCIYEFHNCLASLHMAVTTFFSDNNCDHLIYALRLCWLLAEEEGFDLEAIINEKRAYNKQRLDHKKENRLKVGGKAY